MNNRRRWSSHDDSASRRSRCIDRERCSIMWNRNRSTAWKAKWSSVWLDSSCKTSISHITVSSTNKFELMLWNLLWLLLFVLRYDQWACSIFSVTKIREISTSRSSLMYRSTSSLDCAVIFLLVGTFESINDSKKIFCFFLLRFSIRFIWDHFETFAWHCYHTSTSLIEVIDLRRWCRP